MPSRAIRFEEQIHGRRYRIEVAPVTSGRWRAQVLNAYGGPSALMPFYGATPELARNLLADWLSRVNRPAPGSA